MQPIPRSPLPFNPSLLRLSGNALLSLSFDLLPKVEGTAPLLPGESPAVLGDRLAECERHVASFYGLSA